MSGRVTYTYHRGYRVSGEVVKFIVVTSLNQLRTIRGTRLSRKMKIIEQIRIVIWETPPTQIKCLFHLFRTSPIC